MVDTFFAADVETDVLLAQQTGRIDRGEGVLGELVAGIDLHGHDRHVVFRVEPNLGNPPDHDPGTLHRGPHLEATDVIKLGLHEIGLAAGGAAQVTDLECKKTQGNQAHGNEKSDPEIKCGTIHLSTPEHEGS